MNVQPVTGHVPSDVPLPARESLAPASVRLDRFDLRRMVGRPFGVDEEGRPVATGGNGAVFGVLHALRDEALGQLARTFRQMANQVRAREERLRRQVEELRIEIDVTRRERKVAEIVGLDCFRDLRGRADELRRIVDAAPAVASGRRSDPE